MVPASSRDIRNLCLMGQTGCGKTTLAEALLHVSGGIPTPGTVERGDTVCDFDAQEKTLGHSLWPSLVHLEWAGHWINLLDTPGLPDLQGRALTALPAVETAIIVINAAAGIEPIARKAMEAAQGKCRMIVVNKIDAEGVDLPGLMEAIRSEFGSVCLPLNLPGKVTGQVVDCFFTPDEAAETAFSSVRAAHEAIVDQVVELDEALMAQYLEQGESLNPEQLHAPFEAALREGHLIPVCFVSARTELGVSALLDVLGRLMPDPTEGNPPAFVKGEGTNAVPVEIQPVAEGHVVAHVFQISNDPYRGKLSFLRIHQGRIQAGGQLYIGDGRKPFKVAHLLRVQGKNQTEMSTGVAGDICAVARVEEIHRDAVLHDSHDEDYLHLPAPRYPTPFYGLAFIAPKHGDEQKLADALHRVCEEDPCLTVTQDSQTRQTVVNGLGALHIKVVLEQLKARNNLTVETSLPSVPYRETITKRAEARYRHKKQSGGAGQFGEVSLQVEPLPRGAGIEFVDQIKGGVIPGNFMPAVEKGVRQAISEGVLAGFPLQDLRVLIVDGKHHDVDSNEIAFSTAARHAMQDAVMAASPQILEPVLLATVAAKDSYFGEISGEFSARRGHVTQTDTPAAGRTVLSARVPMAELEGFEARLKAICAGDSECVLAHHGYEPAPQEVQSKLAKAHEHVRGGMSS